MLETKPVTPPFQFLFSYDHKYNFREVSSKIYMELQLSAAYHRTPTTSCAPQLSHHELNAYTPIRLWKLLAVLFDADDSKQLGLPG